MSDETPRDQAAYHEAGHAVAAYLLRRSFTRVSIVPDDDTLGHVKYRGYAAGFRPDLEITLRVRERLEAAVMTSLAGVEAQRVYEPTAAPEDCGGESDYRAAIDLASYVSPDPEELGAYLEWLRLRVAGIFKLPVHWAATRAVAEALLVRQILSAPATRKLIGSALFAYVNEQLVQRPPVTITR